MFNTFLYLRQAILEQLSCDVCSDLKGKKKNQNKPASVIWKQYQWDYFWCSEQCLVIK